MTLKNSVSLGEPTMSVHSGMVGDPRGGVSTGGKALSNDVEGLVRSRGKNPSCVNLARKLANNPIGLVDHSKRVGNPISGGNEDIQGLNVEALYSLLSEFYASKVGVDSSTKGVHDTTMVGDSSKEFEDLNGGLPHISNDREIIMEV